MVHFPRWRGSGLDKAVASGRFSLKKPRATCSIGPLALSVEVFGDGGSGERRNGGIPPSAHCTL